MAQPIPWKTFTISDPWGVWKQMDHMPMCHRTSCAGRRFSSLERESGKKALFRPTAGGYAASKLRLVREMDQGPRAGKGLHILFERAWVQARISYLVRDGLRAPTEVARLSFSRGIMGLIARCRWHVQDYSTEKLHPLLHTRYRHP